ncbi:hypothetical protein RHS04_01512 [Rhizoctonia solani]|uniref:Uncharacterized protein n=1 Tax=Rhizoctonia solani TaxID=456999 RepID=A0A8H7HD56_9AGAM|nr:hypothetical protein RHS04_01512 [Rhizoctonia solani]
MPESSSLDLVVQAKPFTELTPVSLNMMTISRADPTAQLIHVLTLLVRDRTRASSIALAPDDSTNPRVQLVVSLPPLDISTMRLLALIVPATALLPYVLAQVQVWGQCGGMACQCLPGSQPPTSGLPPTPTTSTITTTTTNSPSCTPSPRGALQPRATGPPIAALDGWAAGSYLQKDRNSDAAILGSFSTRGWLIGSGSLRLINYSGTCILFLYLNILPAATSYKPLAFQQTGTTFNWGFNGPNSTLSTSDGFNTFVTCSGGALYLQTGTDVPSGSCTTTRLQIGQY